MPAGTQKRPPAGMRTQSSSRQARRSIPAEKAVAGSSRPAYKGTGPFAHESEAHGAGGYGKSAHGVRCSAHAGSGQEAQAAARPQAASRGRPFRARAHGQAVPAAPDSPGGALSMSSPRRGSRRLPGFSGTIAGRAPGGAPAKNFFSPPCRMPCDGLCSPSLLPCKGRPAPAGFPRSLPGPPLLAPCLPARIRQRCGQQKGDGVTEHSYAVIGGGLAGCECALRLARAGLQVTLFEQKPAFRSPAHVSDGLAELVCSNSLRSDELTSGIGLLKAEMRELGSDFMELADAHRVPAGKALAVDREAFSTAMTRRILSTPGITLVHRQITSLDDPALDDFGTVVLAAGPLASENLSASLAGVVGGDHCYFYDAIAPIVWTHSLNRDIVFRASRYGQEKGETGGDYLNCPMNRGRIRGLL